MMTIQNLTPNQSPEPTRVIVFFYDHKISGLPSHRSRVAQLFSLGIAAARMAFSIASARSC
jgi:hypothetical protein